MRIKIQVLVRHKLEFAKGQIFITSLDVTGIDSWRKWPREPAGHCRCRANNFLKHRSLPTQAILRFSKDCCMYKQVPGQKNAPEMHERSPGLPWPHVSGAEGTEAQWSENPCPDRGSSAMLSRTGTMWEHVVPAQLGPPGVLETKGVEGQGERCCSLSLTLCICVAGGL